MARSFTITSVSMGSRQTWGMYILLGFIACLYGYVMSHNMVAGLGILGALIGLSVFFACMASEELGLYINMVYAFFAYYFSRLLLNDALQVGIGTEALVFATLLGMIIRRVPLRDSFGNFTHTWIGFCMLVLVLGYNALEIASPYGQAFIGWVQVMRKGGYMIGVLTICFQVFRTFATMKRYLTILFVLCLLCGLYGCFQEWHGLFNYEIDWVQEDEMKKALMYIGGQYRKFSTMPDPVALAIIMSSTGVFFMILGLGQKKVWRKIVLVSSACIMLLSMTYSGTRTGNAMMLGGLLIFMILTINKRSTIIFTICAAGLFVGLLYAPIYDNQVLNRFRSTFTGSHDESYMVREVNRAFIQPYIYAHPFGGGLNTTGGNGVKYTPGHYLAGFPPDSGYLKKALEAGWIGLIFYMITYFSIMFGAIRGYFAMTDPTKKLIYAASVSFFFSFYVAEYSQESIGEISDLMVYFPILAIVMKLKTLKSP